MVLRFCTPALRCTPSNFNRPTDAEGRPAAPGEFSCFVFVSRFPTCLCVCVGWGRDALEGEGPQRRLDRRLEDVVKAVGGGYRRLQMPLKSALGVSGTVAGRRLGALQGGGGGGQPPPPFHCIPWGGGGHSENAFPHCPPCAPCIAASALRCVLFSGPKVQANLYNCPTQPPVHYLVRHGAIPFTRPPPTDLVQLTDWFEKDPEGTQRTPRAGGPLRGSPQAANGSFGLGSRVFNLGGGVSIEPPKTGGFGKTAGLTGPLHRLSLTLPPKAPQSFLSIEKGHCFPSQYMANDGFSEPHQHADSKDPIFIFCRLLGRGHRQGPGVSLGRILGGPSIQRFFCIDPPKKIESPPTLLAVNHQVVIVISPRWAMHRQVVMVNCQQCWRPKCQNSCFFSGRTPPEAGVGDPQSNGLGNASWGRVIGTAVVVLNFG